MHNNKHKLLTFIDFNHPLFWDDMQSFIYYIRKDYWYEPQINNNYLLSVYDSFIDNNQSCVPNNKH